MKEQNEKEIVELALLAGHILLENGAEIFRVEETMERICSHFGVESASEFVLSNGIFITMGNERERVFAKVQHIPVSGTHLDKVAAVNQLSREIAGGAYTPRQALDRLRQIQSMPGKRKSVRILASGLGSGAFCFLFGGNLRDSLAAMAAGLLLYVYVLKVGSRISKIVANIGGGALITVVCAALYLVGLGQHLNFMIIGSIMPLVPGVAFTNAIRDVADADYISGMVRMLDALLVFFCVAAGVGLGISILSRLTGGALL